MPTYSIKAPDGNTYTLDGPEGASQESVQAEVMRQHPNAGGGAPPAAPAPQKNFFDHVSDAIGQTYKDLGGAADAAYSGLSHVVTAPISGAAGLINRGLAAVSGGNADEAAKAAKDYVDQHLVYHPQTDIGKEIGSMTQNALSPIADSAQAGADLLAKGGSKIGIPEHETQSALSELGDIANVLPVAGGAMKAVSGIKAANAAEAATDAAAASRGAFATGEGHDIAKSVAGQSGVDARVIHNGKITNVIASHESGVPHGTDITSDSLQAAREAPSAVYNRLASALPEGPLSPGANAAVTAAGDQGRITKGSPDAIKQINDLRDKLLDPQGSFTGDQVVNELRGLRQEGYKNIASDDVSNQQIGKAQLDMARGLETHIDETLPGNADVSIDQLKAARQALAKNHAVEASLTGPNTGEIDPKKLARMHEADGNQLTGGLKDIAEAVQANPKAFGVPGKIDVPPGYAEDVFSGGHAMAHPESLLSVRGLTSLGGGKAIARKILTGDSDAAVAATKNAFPGRDDSQFAPLKPQQKLLPAPQGQQPFGGEPAVSAGAGATTNSILDQLGLTPDVQAAGAQHPGAPRLGPEVPEPAPAPASVPFQGPQNWQGLSLQPEGGAPAAAGGQPGGLSLADLLSGGVEQRPAPGLSLAPEGAPPAPQGLPFKRDAGHMAGDLQTQPEDAWFKGGAPSLGDELAGVMSSNVPDGTMTRTPKKPRFKAGDVISNNASGESSASLEAQNRVKAEKKAKMTRVMIDADGKEHPIAATVDAVDQKADRGSIIVMKGPHGDYQIEDRGGLAPALAKGLMERAKILNRSLGHAF